MDKTLVVMDKFRQVEISKDQIAIESTAPGCSGEVVIKFDSYGLEILMPGLSGEQTHQDEFGNPYTTIVYLDLFYLNPEVTENPRLVLRIMDPSLNIDEIDEWPKVEFLIKRKEE